MSLRLWRSEVTRRLDEEASAFPANRVIYQHPLAYLLGLEGIALLRAFSGVYDRDFTLARLSEIQGLLDSADELGEGVELHPATTLEVYTRWARYYDEPGNLLIDLEEPIVREIFDGLPVGVALDAACGTGRHTAYLATLGYKVIGVDNSPEMLARAREKVPEGEFYEADLHDVPLADDSVDLVVCALSLVHVPDLTRALAEFVRVLRPNGHLVISDGRGLVGDIGLPQGNIGPDGTFGYMPSRGRLTSDYLGAALPLGLQVRRCNEPRRPFDLYDEDGTDLYDGAPPPEHIPGSPPNVWALHPYCFAAANAAFRGNPVAIIWHFQLSVD
jgi:SAM-dependent methyltransferase